MARTARIGKGGRGRPGNSSSPVPGGESRQPTLCWTPARQIIYQQMKADYDANPSTPTTLGGQFYKTIKLMSDTGVDGTYGTGFLWSTFLYQVTGDTTYSDRAWNYIDTEFIQRYNAGTINLGDSNRPRETLQTLVLGLDWLWPALSAADRAAYQDMIGQVLDAALGGNQFVPEGYASSDSDQIIAYYFGVAMFYLICPTDDRAAYWFNFVSSSSIRLSYGGLTSTASNRTTTARNCIRHYVETLAAGGEWCESTEYNAASTYYVLSGYDAILTHTGIDYFPEITAWLPDLAERQMAIWAPDFDTLFKWGDVEHPEGGDLPFDSFHLMPSNLALMGLLQDTERGMQLADFIDEIFTIYSPYVNWASGGFANFDTPWGYMTCNPYATRGDHTTRPKTWHAAGTAMTIQKSGHASTDSMFAIAYGNRADERYLDHMPAILGHFSHYKNHEWVLDYPQVYGVNVWGQFVNNVPLMCGLSWCYEYNHVEHQTDGTLFDGVSTYCYGVCTTAGCTAGFTPLFNPPTVNVHEWTRELFFAGGTTDTIVVFDRGYVDAIDATQLAKHPATHQTTISNAPSRHQFMFQIQEAATLTYANSRYNWSSPESATPIRWYPLLPAVQTRTVYDLDVDNSPVINWNQVYAGAGSTGAVERAAFDQVRIWPTVQASWHTFLNVFQVGATPGAVTLLEDSGKVQGVHVVRTGQSDLVVLFNSEQSAALNTTAFHASHAAAIPLQRFRETGFTVSWTATAAVTDIFFNDLNPANTWTRNIDAGGAVAITEDTGGHFRTEHAGTGPHTMVVVGT